MSHTRPARAGAQNLLVVETSYILPSRIEGDTIQILHVLHGVRQWSEWFDMSLRETHKRIGRSTCTQSVKPLPSLYFWLDFSRFPGSRLISIWCRLTR